MPIRSKKIYNRPRKMFDKKIMKEEQALVKRYGLKNRREVWKAGFAIGKIRDIAKELISASDEDKKKFVQQQKEKGFSVETISDVLALNVEDYLKRRLQSILVKKGLCTKPKQARQFITHKHVSINKNIINAPSHLTTAEEEQSISLDIALPAKKLTKDEETLLEEIKHKEEPKKEDKLEEEISEEEE
jgi:small subunit ribosomal protein S4